MKCDEEAPSGCCEELKLERIRYFTGRPMTARDFRDEDAYHRTFRRLHNRILHGWGIACGLEVARHWRAECLHDRVVVRCGLALDCCGREIVVPKDLVPPRIPWDDKPKGAQGAPDPDVVLLLCLRYCETLTEKVPVLYSKEACSCPSMEDGRIREGYALCWRWVRREDLPGYGWNHPDGCAPPEEPPPDDPCAEEHRCCLEPQCPPDHCVPLAVLVRAPDRDAEPRYDIDMTGRRSIVQAREHLTHVCWISWTHGGVVKASEMKSLRVRFDRPLRDPERPDLPGPLGINERTFVVQFGEQLENVQTEDLDFVDYETPPYLEADRRTAVYEVRKPNAYRNHVVHVTLRCDFLVDCRGNPVDGDHLRGSLPTGNGLPGGTFESWFRVAADDAEYDRLLEEDGGSQDAQDQE